MANYYAKFQAQGSYNLGSFMRVSTVSALDMPIGSHYWDWEILSVVRIFGVECIDWVNEDLLSYAGDVSVKAPLTPRRRILLRGSIWC